MYFDRKDDDDIDSILFNADIPYLDFEFYLYGVYDSGIDEGVYVFDMRTTCN